MKGRKGRNRDEKKNTRPHWQNLAHKICAKNAQNHAKISKLALLKIALKKQKLAQLWNISTGCGSAASIFFHLWAGRGGRTPNYAIYQNYSGYCATSDLPVQSSLPRPGGAQHKSASTHFFQSKIFFNVFFRTQILSIKFLFKKK